MGHNTGRRQAERDELIAQRAAMREAEFEAAECVKWFNDRLANGKRPWLVPTIGAALVSKHHWLTIACDACGMVNDLDLRVKRRPANASILTAVNDVRCPRCNGHGRPRLTFLSRAPSH